MGLIKSVHWDITKKCNLRCKHCYNSDKYFDKESDVYMESEMTFEECIHTVESFANAGFGHIHFLGGEPLASPYIFEVIKRIKDLGMLVSINSNACLLNEEVQQKIIDLKVDQFAASVDGCTAVVNDSIRGDGTFEKTLSNMKQLNERKKKGGSLLETAIVFTLTKQNLCELTKLPALAEKLGVNLIVLTTFIESGEGRKNCEVFHADFNTICDTIELMVAKELTKYNIPLQIDMRPRFCEYLANTYNAPVIYNLKNSLCCAGEDIWYMEANGDVHPCLIFQLEAGKSALNNNVYKKEIININSNKIEEIKKSNYWKSFIEAKHQFVTEKISTCMGCNFLNGCQPCFIDYGSYNIPILECEWTKKKEILLFNKIAEKKMRIKENVTFDNKRKFLVKDEQPILFLDPDISYEIWRLIEEENTPSTPYLKFLCKFSRMFF